MYALRTLNEYDLRSIFLVEMFDLRGTDIGGGTGGAWAWHTHF